MTRRGHVANQFNRCCSGARGSGSTRSKRLAASRRSPTHPPFGRGASAPLENFETTSFDRSGTPLGNPARAGGQPLALAPPRRPDRPHRRSAIRGRPSGSRKGKRKGGATKSRARGFRDRTCQIRPGREACADARRSPQNIASVPDVGLRRPPRSSVHVACARHGANRLSRPA
jgi:hypothetical protein